jgi:triphosphatase
MALEQEIKLALPHTAVAAATDLLTQLAGAAPASIALANIYFDTPECALAGIKSAVRLRHTPQGWLQTFKSGGGAHDGLHSRNEWEMPVAGPRLEPAALLAACAADPAALVLKLAVPALHALFRTDFTRLLWNLQHEGAQIEAALDRGAVTLERDTAKPGNTDDPSGPSVPICEVELELKHGDPAALHSLAQQLRARVPQLAPDNTSKAQRGYRLYRG